MDKLRLLVFREWKDGKPAINAKVYTRECSVNEIEDYTREGEANGYVVEHIYLEGEY